MKKQKLQRIVNEPDYNQEIIDWERSVRVLTWTHDFEKKIYIIDYLEKN